MVESPLSDMLIRIKNGYLAGQKTVEVPYSKTCEELAKILLQGEYLVKVEVKKTKSSAKKKAIEVKFLELTLKYVGKTPVLEEVKIVSKPSVRTYVKRAKIPSVLGGRGMVILSTPQGLMSGREARKRGFGGEIVCELW